LGGVQGRLAVLRSHVRESGHGAPGSVVVREQQIPEGNDRKKGNGTTGAGARLSGAFEAVEVDFAEGLEAEAMV